MGDVSDIEQILHFDLSQKAEKRYRLHSWKALRTKQLYSSHVFPRTRDLYGARPPFDTVARVRNLHCFFRTQSSHPRVRSAPEHHCAFIVRTSGLKRFPTSTHGRSIGFWLRFAISRSSTELCRAKRTNWTFLSSCSECVFFCGDALLLLLVNKQ